MTEITLEQTIMAKKEFITSKGIIVNIDADKHDVTMMLDGNKYELSKQESLELAEMLIDSVRLIDSEKNIETRMREFAKELEGYLAEGKTLKEIRNITYVRR